MIQSANQPEPGVVLARRMRGRVACAMARVLSSMKPASCIALQHDAGARQAGVGVGDGIVARPAP